MAISVIAYFSHWQRFSVEVDKVHIVLSAASWKLVDKVRWLCRNTVVMRNDVGNGSKQEITQDDDVTVPGRMRSWLQPEDDDRGNQINWSMNRVHAFGMADHYMGPRFWVCFDSGMLELLLGKPQVVSSPETTAVPLKAMEVNKGTKTVWSKGYFLKVNWKKQVEREDGSCLFSVDTEHSAWDCFISTLTYSQRKHILRGSVVNVTVQWI